MRLKNQPIRSHQVLVALCSCDLTEEETRAARSYTFCQSVEIASLQMTHSRYACVIACIDPSKKESIDQLWELRDATRLNNMPLATVSNFNPIWIENLLAQFGIIAHFKRFPDITQIAEAAENGISAGPVDIMEPRQ